MNSFLDIGIEKVTNGKRAFVNFTEKLLLDEIATILPSSVLVIEVLETVEPTPEIIAACSNLRERGYIIALDDFIIEPRYMPLIAVADIIKVDFLASSMDEITNFAGLMKGKPIRLLAEKLENNEMFETAKKLGFDLFQGFFFSKPVVLQQQKGVSPLKINCMQLIRYSLDPDVNYNDMAAIFKQDTVLSYMLLRVVNSAFFGLRYTVSSIRQALAILGMDELKKWVTMISMSRLRDNKPTELITMALVRARFLEHLGPKAGISKNTENLFMVGMLSLMDVIMDIKMEDVIIQTSVAPDIAEAVLTKDGKYGNLLSLIISYEVSAWDKVTEIAAAEGISMDDINMIYIEAIDWAAKANR
jgi:EAL and modified HD-GYP domain-containing signal transduction protein